MNSPVRSESSLLGTVRPGVASHSWLHRLYDLLFSIFIFTTIFFPSGTLYGINLKLPLYAALIPLAGYRFFRGRATAYDLIRVLCVPAVLALWIVVGLVYGFDPAGVLRQYTDILLTMLLCWFATLFRGQDEAQSFRLARLVLGAEITTCAMKLGLIAYSLLRGIPVVQVVGAVSEAFGVNLMTMDLGALFGRVQFVSDFLIPVCIFIVFRYRNRLGFSSWRASYVILLLLVSVTFSFSRYLWAFSVLALLLGLVLGKRDRFQLSVIGVLALAVLASLPALSVLYQLRFSEQVAGESDLERTDQSVALRQFFLDAPLLGHGLGSFSNQVIRDNSSKASRYGYEMQILALAGQVGVGGMGLLAALIVWYYRDLWSRDEAPLSDRLAITTLLLCWFAVGLYNPLLLNPVAGVNYMTFAALAALHPVRKGARARQGAVGKAIDRGLLPHPG